MKKHLQIQFSDQNLSQNYEIEPNLYIIKTKESLLNLYITLREWVNINKQLLIDDYNSILKKRLSGKNLEFNALDNSEIFSKKIDNNLSESDISREKSRSLNNWQVIKYKKDITPNFQESSLCQSLLLEPVYFYIGIEAGHLRQYSTASENVTRNYNKIMEGDIYSLAVTKNKPNLFVSDSCGNLKQICLASHRVKKDYGKIHKSI